MTRTRLRQFGDELTASYRLTLQRFVTLQLRGSEQAPKVLAQLCGEFLARDEPSREALPFLSHPDAFLAALAELAHELPDGA